MTAQEIMGIIGGIPPSIKDLALFTVILSLVEISPVKLNPWQWLKKFYMLPERMQKLEEELNNDRVFRWRSMILRRADYITNGEKFSRETWDDTIETIDNYERYCRENPDIKNGKAVAAIDFLHRKYANVIENNDFLR